MVAIWFAQSFPFQFRVIDYYQNTHQAIDHYIQTLQGRGYTYGSCVLPWDGGARHLGTGKSIEELIRSKGYRARVIPQAKVADGINAVRTIFPQCWFDAEKCDAGLKGLRRYQWGPPSSSGVLRREPLHDDASHPADALRTMAMSIKTPPAAKPKGTAQPMPVSAWS
jgi:phage terminase large subunit